MLCRLLDYATNYFNLPTFTDGETKRALQRVVKTREGIRNENRPLEKKQETGVDGLVSGLQSMYI